MSRKRKIPVSVNLSPKAAKELKQRAENKDLFVSEYTREIILEKLYKDRK
tara:strand:- start:563 stop:712 length:150 start_codon:yes stop_codon:yes gene_type:complete